MEKEKELIIPTQNILFAVLKDGEIVTNDHNKDGNYSPDLCVGLVEGIIKYQNQLSEKDFMLFSLGWGLLSRTVTDALLTRVRELEKKENPSK